jgi:hypothetical protein
VAVTRQAHEQDPLRHRGTVGGRTATLPRGSHSVMRAASYSAA